jgi:hypothetical protein
MDAALCYRCESAQAAEEIEVVVALQEVADEIMNVQLVQPAKASVSVTYTLKMTPTAITALEMNEAVEMDAASVAGHMGQVAVDS